MKIKKEIEIEVDLCDCTDALDKYMESYYEHRGDFCSIFMDEPYVFYALEKGMREFNKDNIFLSSVIEIINSVVGIKELEKAIKDWKREWGEE